MKDFVLVEIQVYILFQNHLKKGRYDWGQSYIRMINLVYTINQKYFEDGSLLKMLDKGIDAFRINLGRTSGEQCCQMCEYIKEFAKKAEKQIMIEVDLPGAKARILTGESCYTFTKEQMFLSDDLQVSGCIYTDANWLFERLERGDILKIGREVEAQVLIKLPHSIKIEIIQGGKIRTRDMILVKNRSLELPMITNEDVNLIKLIRKADFDYLAISFTQSVEQIETIRNLLNNVGITNIKLLAKIEEDAGMRNYQEFLSYVDGILIGRGDLSEHIGMQATNEFIKDVLNNWKWEDGEKECILASYYFIGYLTKGKLIDPAMMTQSRFPVTYFVTDESSYHDWNRIYNAYNKNTIFAGYLSIADEMIGLYCNTMSYYNYINSLFQLEGGSSVKETTRIEFFYEGEQNKDKTTDCYVIRKDNEVYVKESRKFLEYRNSVAKCRIFASVTNSEALYYTYVLPSIKVIMAEKGKICIHGAVYQNSKGETVAVIGPSGCGKTTLMVLMMNHGMTAMTDDLFFVDMKEEVLATFMRPAHVDISLCEYYPWLAECLKDSEPYMKGRKKYNFDFYKIDTVKSCLSLKLPDQIVFPVIGNQDKVIVEEVSEKAAISRILSQMYFHKEINASDVMEFIGRYQKKCKLLLLGKNLRNNSEFEIQKILEAIN